MQKIRASHALIGTAWQQDVLIEIDIATGRIASVTANAAQDGTAPDASHVGLLVPAPANAHSHAFQRAMAGLTEKHGPGADSFWTWRALMYRFLQTLTPDHIEAITAFVQMEMLEAGFGASVEFHYLHHAPDGQPYDNLAETSTRITAAAAQSGMGLTLLPVFYQYGGCDQRALGPGQDRFGNDLTRYLRLKDGAAKALADLPSDAVLGVAPHSLRAVSCEDLAALREGHDGPFHMHLAEQPAEVKEVEAAYGRRPVDWVLEHLAPGPGDCFIHCTQMQPKETEGLARSGAVAGLCPLTEASLGDGIFDGVRWMGAGGRIAIGSDSNIRISLAEELRQLDTSQRLRDHSRAALAAPEHGSGRRLMQAAAEGGAQVAGRGAGQIAVGAWADLLALDTGHPDLAGLTPDTALDSFVFAGGNEMVRDVWSGGRHMVQAGRHVARAGIVARYGEVARALRSGM